MGKVTALRIIEHVENSELDLNFCIGQTYDNGVNMTRQYKGVQVILQ
jgi:hypothetical protein